MGLLRTLLWFVLFLAATFAFTVLFEYGWANFGANAQKEWASLVEYYHKQVDGAPAKPKSL